MTNRSRRREVMRVETGETIRFKDIWSNVALAIGTLSDEARTKVEKMLKEIPDPDKEVVYADDLNKRWDAIFEILNEDLK